MLSQLDGPGMVPNSYAWMKNFVLETENFEGKTLALSRSIHIALRCTAVAEVTCLTSMDGKFQVQPSPVFIRDNPNVYCKPIIYEMSPDKDKRDKIH